MRIIILFILFITVFFELNGQNTDNQPLKNKSSELFPENVRVFQDEKIDMLVKQFLDEERSTSGIVGYRIRIFSDSGQKAGENAKSENARFIGIFPKIKSYIKFDTPNYRVYVGDFRTRSEAIKLLIRIEQYFPSAFIIKTRIGYNE